MRIGRKTGIATAVSISALASIATFNLDAQGRRVARDGELLIAPHAAVHAALGAASIDDDAAVSSILNTLRTGFPVFPQSASALASDDGARLRLVRALARVLPQVFEGEAFADVYGRYRASTITSQLPAAPVDPALARQDSIGTMRGDLEGLRDERSAPGLSRSARNRLDDRIEETQDRLRAAEREANSNSVRERDQRALATAREQYEQRRTEVTASIDASLPADGRVAVARRLREFVDGCSDVDFRAATTTTNGVKRFTRAEYEAKPRLWKLCFRAGRRTTDEARRLARSWLGSLERSGVRP